MSLNDKLLKLKIYYCIKCNNLLNSPVMQVKYCEFICGRCYKKEDNKEKYNRNTDIEEILQLLIIPCRYQKNGCTKQVSYECITDHEWHCKFKKFNCLSFGNNCSWTGLPNDIVKHFENDHPDLLIKSENYQFPYVINNNSIVENKLLNSNNELFLLHVNNNTNNCSFVIYHVFGDCENLTYYIEEIDVENFCMKKTNKKIIEKYDEDININNPTIIDLTLLKNMSNIEIYIQIYENNINEVNLNEELLSNFECPICTSYMCSKIYQCKLGHSICEECRGKITVCSTCKEEFLNCRNFLLEKIISNVNVPCDYRKKGCGFIATGDEIKNHNLICTVKPINCPVNECTWQDRSVKLVPHLKETHNLLENNETLFSVNEIKNKTIVAKLMIAYENVFKIEFRKSSYDINCNCTQIIGNHSKYKFEVVLCSLMKNNLCGNVNDTVNKNLEITELNPTCEEIIVRIIN